MIEKEHQESQESVDNLSDITEMQKSAIRHDEESEVDDVEIANEQIQSAFDEHWGTDAEWQEHQPPSHESFSGFDDNTDSVDNVPLTDLTEDIGDTDSTEETARSSEQEDALAFFKNPLNDVDSDPKAEATAYSPESAEQVAQPSTEPPKSTDSVKSEPTTKPKEKSGMPWYTNQKIMLTIVATVFGLLSFGGYQLVTGLLNAQGNSTPVVQAPQSKSESATHSADQEGGQDYGGINASNELGGDNDATETNKVFNGVDVEVLAVDEVFVNVDPMTRDYIAQLQLKIEQQNQTMSAYSEKMAKDERALESSSQTISQLQNQLTLLQGQYKSEQSKNANLTRSLDSQTKKLVTLETTNERLTKDFQRSQEQLSVSKAQYQALLTQKSGSNDEILKQLDEIKTVVSKTQQVQSINAARKPLAQLKFVSVDAISQIGKFVVLRDNQAVKAITLQPQEALKGRGTVERVDMYGCIHFVGGERYQPLNGYCPSSNVN